MKIGSGELIDGRKNICVRIEYCSQSGAWIATSDDISGLGATHASLGAVHEMIADQIPHLLEAHHDLKYDPEEICISFVIDEVPIIKRPCRDGLENPFRDKWFSDDSTTELTRGVGNSISSAMVRNEINVDRLASLLDISAWKAWRLLSGKMNLPMRQLERIAAELHSTVEIRLTPESGGSDTEDDVRS